MSVRAITGVGAMVLAGAALAGCGRSEAEFVLHADTQQLVPAARRAVEERLSEDFGDPHKLVAWELLPVDFGGHAGVIEGTPDGTSEDRIDVLQVRFEVPVDRNLLEPGLRLTFTSGDYEGQSTRVLEFDPGESLEPPAGQSTLVIQDSLESPPKAGDRFVLDFGRTLRAGQTAYMVHCQHCHGVSGDGDGPTAQYLNPRPRDYRLGIFKFISTTNASPPRREDLERIVRDGIPGTYMPSFALIAEEERDAIIEYVRWLSMRGMYEQAMLTELSSAYSQEEIDNALAVKLADYERTREGPKPTEGSVQQELIETVAPFPVEELGQHAAELAESVASAWASVAPETSEILPKEPRRILPVSKADVLEGRHTQEEYDAYLASLSRGYDLYQKNCNNCHGPTGRGDGAQTESFQPLPTDPNKTYDEPGLFDRWGEPIQPRDLTRGIYRGGRRPIDIYRRIHQGISGTPMPPFNTKFVTPQGETDDQQIWDLVNYVLYLPHQETAGPFPKPVPSDPLPVEAETTGTGGAVPEEPEGE